MFYDETKRTRERFVYKPIGTEQGSYDIYATYQGKQLMIATIRDRKFKRVKCKEWKTTCWSDLLDTIQSHAGLHAAETGRTGPL